MTARKQHLDGLAVITLLACCAVWGIGQVASKATLAEVPPLLQAAARSIGAALLVAIWSGWRGIALLSRDGTWQAGLAAGLLFAVEFACIFTGLKFTTASRMVVFVYLAPFVVALGMPFVSRGERLDRVQTVGLVLAFGAVAWAFAEGFQQPSVGALQWVGDALGVAGAVFWGFTTLLIRASRLANAAAEKTLFYQLAVSGVALAAASWIYGEAWPTRLSSGPLAWLAFQIVVVSFASYLLWFWLVRHYPATQLSAFTLLTPLLGLLAGVALMADPLTIRLVCALIGVSLGILLVHAGRNVLRSALASGRGPGASTEV
ncbi:MAG TPA: DMT family transporter [Burkholderiaceae bacterium]|nr:DMT family transporter [Burkholderiaceae bacterium]